MHAPTSIDCEHQRHGRGAVNNGSVHCEHTANAEHSLPRIGVGNGVGNGVGIAVVVVVGAIGLGVGDGVGFGVGGGVGCGVGLGVGHSDVLCEVRWQPNIESVRPIHEPPFNALTQ